MSKKSTTPRKTKTETTKSAAPIAIEKRTIRLVRGHKNRNMDKWSTLAVDLAYLMRSLGEADAEDFDMHLSVRWIEPKPGQKDRPDKAHKPLKPDDPPAHELREAHSKAWHVLATWLRAHASKEMYELLYDMESMTMPVESFYRTRDKTAYRKMQRKAIERINAQAAELEARERTDAARGGRQA